MKKGNELRYWRTKSKAEIDFVLEKQGANIAIEVKSTLSSNKTGRALFSFREKYHVHKTAILSESFSFVDKANDILFLPLFFI